MKFAAWRASFFSGLRRTHALIVSVGQTFAVEVEDISTTGYTWLVEGFNSSIVAATGESIIKPGAAPVGIANVPISSGRARADETEL
jgi:hypothetical protein